MQTVPKRWAESWALANYEVVGTWIQDADESSNTYHDALQRDLLLHKFLLISNKRLRKGRLSGHSIGVRMQFFLRGNYQELVRRLQHQVQRQQALQRRNSKRGNHTPLTQEHLKKRKKQQSARLHNARSRPDGIRQVLQSTQHTVVQGCRCRIFFRPENRSTNQRQAPSARRTHPIQVNSHRR